MRSAGNITEARDSGPDEGILDVLPHIERRPAIERQIAALGADKNLLPRKSSIA